jgi:predicted glycoside hydrolase/deacetylase ChbG (UPF0249 family)
MLTPPRVRSLRRENASRQMTLKIKRQAEKSSVTSLKETTRSVVDTETAFDPSFLLQIRGLAAAGLTPSSALALITQLIAETPEASKETMDRIKMVDKLLNTARAMMETRLKNDEAAAIAARLDEMELFIEKLAIQKAGEPNQCREIRDDRGDRE